MTPAQKQTTQYELLSEKKVMEQLERSYQKALEDVKDRLRQLDERTDEENRQAVAYQKAFQQGLQKQLERILGKLHSKTYRTVQEYLQDCYLTGHTAVLYELQSDGLRLSLPVPQDKVCQAAVNDTKLVKPLYDSIGEDFAGLKKHITDIVSAGFASGASYGDMANQITGKMIGNYATLRGGALGRAKLIVRTEGNRIANAARLEAARTAKQQGADLVKQWDSTMDKKTRPHHVQLDGQVRELDEPFEVDGRKAQAPGKFGIASEDINCRCHAYSRPRWAVRADGDYKYDNQHRALVKVSSESYAAYRAGYVQETAGKPDGTVPVPAGHAVEVTPPAIKDNGGTGKTYRAEKIGGKTLTSGGDGGIIRDEKIVNAVSAGEISLKLNPEKQNAHILSAPGYDPAENKSYFTIPLEEIQEIVNQYYGTGEVTIGRNGIKNAKEYITVPYDLGVCVTKSGEILGKTNLFRVHYSKSRTHAVPAKKEEQE